MTKSNRPDPPPSLADAGKSLWKTILGDLDGGWELDARELHLLGQACRCADDLAALDQAITESGPIATGSRGQTVVHPAMAEARQLRLVQARLLGSIELADPNGDQAATPAQARARHAARVRWAREREADHG